MVHDGCAAALISGLGGQEGTLHSVHARSPCDRRPVAIHSGGCELGRRLDHTGGGPLACDLFIAMLTNKLYKPGARATMFCAQGLGRVPGCVRCMSEVCTPTPVL